MKLPWKNNESAADQQSSSLAARKVDAASIDDPSDQAKEAPVSAAFTPKKGKPTPKRNEVERQIGVRKTSFEAPATPAEARKRRKELKSSMSKEEYKAFKQRQRDEASRERRKVNERMMAGDEQYLMDRDKGPEKRFVRDYVDSRRFIMNFFLPLTFFVLIIMLVGTRNPEIANLSTIFMLVMFIIIVGEGVWVGRKINRMVSERFPDNPHGGFALGMYAFTRATMIRRFRTPAPQKNIGDSV